MEYGSIERELHIDASPEVVYQVISSPEHLREWWPDEAELEPVPGATGVIRFDTSAPEPKVVPLMVVEAEPYRRVSFPRGGGGGGGAAAAPPPPLALHLGPSGAGTRPRAPEAGGRGGGGGGGGG